jgi:hypothetical protein
MLGYNEAIPLIIFFFVLAAGIFGYFISSGKGRERKRITDRIAMSLSIIVILMLAGYSWHIIDDILKNNRSQTHVMDRQMNNYLSSIDSLRKALNSANGISISLNLALDEGFSEKQSLERTIDELESLIDSTNLSGLARERHIRSIEKDKRDMKARMIEVARGAHNKVEAVTESLAQLAAIRESTVVHRETKGTSKLAFAFSTSDSAGYGGMKFTYYIFYADPSSDLQNISIYFKLDRPFVELEDVSEESVANRRTQFIAETGRTGFYYRSSELLVGEAIRIRAMGEETIKPRMFEPPVLSP